MKEKELKPGKMVKKGFEKSILIFFSGLFAVLIVYFFGLVNPYLARHREISAEIEAKSQELELFREEKGGVSSLELIESIEASQVDNQKKITLLKGYLGTFDIETPSQVTQKGLFFKEKAHEIERRLREAAEKKNVFLPASLGFDKGVPKEEETAKFLWELAAIEKVVETLIKSEVDNLVSLKLKKAQEQNQGGIVYTSIPIEISCQGETTDLLNFVHSLSRASAPLIIEKLIVQKKFYRDGTKKLEIDLTLQGIYLH